MQNAQAMHRFTTCLLFVIALAPGCLPTQAVDDSSSPLGARPTRNSDQSKRSKPWVTRWSKPGFGVDSMETGDPTTDDDDTGVAIPSHVLRGGIRFRFPNVKAFDIGL